jgi:hypothetical protein
MSKKNDIDTMFIRESQINDMPITKQELMYKFINGKSPNNSITYIFEFKNIDVFTHCEYLTQQILESVINNKYDIIINIYFNDSDLLSVDILNQFTNLNFDNYKIILNNKKLVITNLLE